MSECNFQFAEDYGLQSHLSYFDDREDEKRRVVRDQKRNMACLFQSSHGRVKCFDRGDFPLSRKRGIGDETYGVDFKNFGSAIPLRRSFRF